MKSPDDPVPSGDRTMARQLVAALQLAGHEVEVISRLKCRVRSADKLERVRTAARREVEQVAARWQAQTIPDLVMAYHVYYKSPDFVGSSLAERFKLPGTECGRLPNTYECDDTPVGIGDKVLDDGQGRTPEKCTPGEFCPYGDVTYGFGRNHFAQLGVGDGGDCAKGADVVDVPGEHLCGFRGYPEAASAGVHHVR